MSTLHPLAPAVPHPAPLRHRSTVCLLLTALFAAPVAWGLQLLVSYTLIGDQCLRAANPGAVPDGPTTALLIVIGVAAIGATVAGLASAWWIWRATRNEGPGLHHAALTAGHGRTRFLALCGMIGSLTFLGAAIFEFAVPFLVTPCSMPGI